MRIGTLCLAFAISTVVCSTAYATPVTLQRTIANPSPDDSDGFGRAVSLSGGKALIGADLDATTGAGSGRAYIVDVATGGLLATLENPTPAINDFFGQAASLSGNLAVVGAPGDDVGFTNSGSAYLFDATTGTRLRTFVNPTPALSDGFGAAVAISGDRVLISAFADHAGTNRGGAAYLFDATTGALLQTFNNPTPANGDNFGSSVAIFGDRVLIGAPSDAVGALGAGSAYLFDANTGALLRTFNNPTPATFDMFGSELALSGTKLLIGSTQDDTAGFNEGAAYLYDVNSGSLLRTLLIPTPTGDSEFFGDGLALSEDWALIGAGFRNKGAPTSQQDLGGAFLFDVNTGLLLMEIADPDPRINDRFGFAVALDGHDALIGAQTDLVGAIRPGDVFYYAGAVATPEPATLGLMTLGLAALSARRRRVRPDAAR